jgi:1-deoxy-D-xylulose-5-phosphate reductoisomerase
VQYALTYPARAAGLTPPLDFYSLGSLTFDRPDGDCFPLLPLAARAYSLGGAVPAVLNAANEEAVAAFLADRLCLVDIFDIVCETVEEYANAAMREETLEGILAIAAEARIAARQRAQARVKK